jgi:hypothetical protein
MPENNVTAPITDQEKAFVHLILSGTMSDRRAAKAAGFHPNSADDIKSRPRVAAYLRERRAALQQLPVEHDTDPSRLARLPRLPRQAEGQAVEEERQLIPTRGQILARLWELAALSAEMTRGSITGQLKAISMIIAIEGFIPDRRAAGPPSSKRNFAPAPTHPQPSAPVPSCRGAQQEDEPAGPASPGELWGKPWAIPESRLAPTPAADPHPNSFVSR